MSTYRIVEANLETERQKILSIWRRNLTDRTKLDEKYDWNFLQNPYGKGRCWILEADGMPVGTAALTMRPISVRGRVVIGGAACDLAVDNEHRFLQPALMLQKTLLSATESSVSLIYGLPNPGGASVMQRAGYQDYGPVHSYTHVLRISGYLARYALLKPYVSVLGKIADLAYSALDQSQEPLIRERVVNLPAEFDERFDQLWHRLKPPDLILTVRNSQFLRWRYQMCPSRTYKTLCLQSEDRTGLSGYLVYYVDNDRAYCTDVFADKKQIEALLVEWVRRTRKAGLVSASIMYAGEESILAILDGLRFSRRTSSAPQGPSRTAGKAVSRTLLVYDRIEDLGQERAGGAQWYFTPGDEPYN